MDLFKVNDQYEKCAREKLTGEENNRYFLQMVSLLTLVNKTFYSPVTFLIEYNNNKSLQKIFEEKTGVNPYNFVVFYMEEFPTVSSSRKLKSNIKPSDRKSV